MLHVKKQLFINFGDEMVRRFFFNFRIADYEKHSFYFEIIVTLFCIPVIYRIFAQKYFKNASKISYKGEFTQYPFFVRFRPFFYVFASP